MVELISALDGLAQRQVAWQDHILSPKGDKEGALSGPWSDPGDGGELGNEIIVGQTAEDIGVQSAVRQPFGEITQRADLSPRQTGLAETAGIHGQQFGRRREMAAKQGLNAGHGPAGSCDRQLLAGYLEEKGPVQINGRKLGHPGPRVESRPFRDKPRGRDQCRGDGHALAPATRHGSEPCRLSSVPAP